MLLHACFLKRHFLHVVFMRAHALLIADYGAQKGEHYDLIVEGAWAKIRQKPQARDVLLSTGDLILRPDHHQSPDAPPAWRYHEILMMIRTDLLKSDSIE